MYPCDILVVRYVIKMLSLCVNFFYYQLTGPVAFKNRLRILLLGRDADIIVKTAAVEMEDEENEIITSRVWF